MFADNSSIALSPPKAARTGLLAFHADHRDKTASILIHVMVTI
jgi:hypothetical protein